MPKRATHNPRLLPQKYIRSHYPARYERNIRELCPNCQHRLSGGGSPQCQFGIVPVTTDGQDCPYYSPELVAVPASE